MHSPHGYFPQSELRRFPTLETPPNPLNATLRPERPEDRDFLAHLYATTREQEMAAAPWTPAEQEAFLLSQFEFQTTHYRRHYHDAEFLVVEKDSVPIGRIYLHRGEAGFELMDIAFLPEWRGSGAGTAFLLQILDEARAAGQPVILYVEMYNRAQNLYARLGFRPVGEEGVYLKMQWLPEPLRAAETPESGDQTDEAAAGQQQR